MAQVSELQKQPFEAISYYRQYLATIEQISKAKSIVFDREQASRQAVSLNNLASLCQDTGQFGLALDSYDKAAPIWRILDDRNGVALTYLNKGLLLDRLGQTGEAITCYLTCLPKYRALGDRNGVAVSLNNLARCHLSEGNYAEAEKCLLEALPLYQSLGNSHGVAMIQNGLSATKVATGRYSEAIAEGLAALPVFQEKGDVGAQATTLSAIGRAHEAMGEPKEAIDCLSQAWELAHSVQNVDLESDVALDLMIQWKEELNLPLATIYGKLCINNIQVLRRSLKGQKARVQTIFLRSRSGIYRYLADILIQQGRLTEAQQVLGLMKESELIDFVRGNSEKSTMIETPEEQEVHARYRAIASKLASLAQEKRQLESHGSNVNRLIAIDKEFGAARGEFELFVKQVASENSKPTDGVVAGLKASSEIQEEIKGLGTDVVLLYTVVGTDVFRELLVTGDYCLTYEVPVGESEVNRKVLAFRQALQSPDLDPRPSGKELYDVVMNPALVSDLDKIGVKTIMWSLDGTLRYAPINALWDGQKYMIERYSNPVFTIATGGTLTESSNRSLKISAMGVSKAFGGFEPLPGVPQELKAVVKNSGNPNGALPGDLELDENFTEDSLIRATAVKHTPIVHIASHFKFQPGDDNQSFLLLGNGQKLTVNKLKERDFTGVELLTLSACDTANGSSGDGKEIESFAMLAQRKKAHAVVAALWPVSDESTPRLMKEFYRQRADGRSKITALQTAQKSLMDGKIAGGPAGKARGAQVTGSGFSKFKPPVGREYSHPFYWAPFILIGNWR